VTVDNILWIAPLATVLISAMTFWAGWIARIAKGEAAALEVGGLKTEVAAVKADLADFKVEVAGKYASNQTIIEMEERVTAAINRLGDRLDRILERRTRG
jgi:hypothetical protein